MNLTTLLKLQILRMLFKGKNYGAWGVIESGGVITNRIASYKESAFVDGKRTFVKPGEDKIYRFQGAPYCIFKANDAEALDLHSKDPVLDIRHPGKLHAFCDLYTAKATAAARRKVQFNPQTFMLLQILTIAGVGIIAYLVFQNHDILAKFAPADTSKDNLLNLVKVN